MFGGIPSEADDLFALVADADVSSLPPVHVSCGESDPLYAGNRAFVDAATGLRAVRPHRLPAPESTNGASRTRAFYQDVLDWLPMGG